MLDENLNAISRMAAAGDLFQVFAAEVFGGFYVARVDEMGVGGAEQTQSGLVGRADGADSRRDDWGGRGFRVAGGPACGYSSLGREAHPAREQTTCYVQGGPLGLDHANTRIPRSLAGQGGSCMWC